MCHDFAKDHGYFQYNAFIDQELQAGRITKVEALLESKISEYLCKRRANNVRARNNYRRVASDAASKARSCKEVVPDVLVRRFLEAKKRDGVLSKEYFSRALTNVPLMDNLDTFNPRKYFLDEGLDLESCKKRWIDLVEKI